MKQIWTLGEALCEIMRMEPDKGLQNADLFKGPFPSGAPAIFIDTAAKLGTPAGLIGTIGRDDFGACIQTRLLADGVDCSHLCISDDLATAVAFVSYTGSGDRTFIFHIGNAAAGQIRYPSVMPKGVGVFHVMGCAMMPSPAMAENVCRAMEHYYAEGATISFDPNIRIESLRSQNLQALLAPVMERCSIFMPGREELLAVAEEADVDKAIGKLFGNPALQIIVLKNGGQGCRVISRKEDFFIPVCKVELVDSTGAGDSFDAGFLSAYLANRPLKECAYIASATGALNCNAFGPMEGNISSETVADMVLKNYGHTLR